MKTTKTGFAYRTWIDGLRAIAVILVILNHYFGLVPAGYIGVDMFFVISGFLVGGIIYEQAVTKQFSLSSFYINRIHRIIPAQLFMIVLIFIALTLLHFPAELLEQYSHEVIYSVLSISNFNYWSSVGYFDLESGRKFLLHTWSLGIEEQFYLIFPVFLLLLLRFKKNTGTCILLSLLVLSLTINYLPFAFHTKFYLLPFRFWEFLAGFGIYYISLTKVPLTRFISWIAIAAFFFLQVNPFHFSALTLIIAGAVSFGLLFLSLENSENTILKQLLSSRVMRYLGKISYSLYLAHWPVMVIMKLKYSVRAPSLLNFLYYIAITFIISIVSYYLVESRFRISGRQPAKKKLLISTTIILLLVFGSSFFIAISRPYSVTHAVTFTTQKYPLGNCGELIVESTYNNYELPTIVFWGDSHAGMMAFDEKAYAGYNIYKIYSTGCPPFFSTVVRTECNCDNPYKILTAWKMIKDLHPTHVILASRFSIYINGLRINNTLRKGNHFISMQDAVSDTSLAERKAAFTHGLTATIDSLATIHAKTIVFKQIPDFSNFHNPEALMLGGVYSVRESSLLKYAGEADDIIDSLQLAGRVTVFDTRAYLRGGRGFMLYDEKGNHLLYHDDSHLSATGSMRITTPLLKTLSPKER